MPAANVLPYQIIAGVADVYVAPVSTAFPAIDDAYGDAGFGTATWRYLGHTDGGIKVGHPQTVVALRTDQVTAPVKAVRSEEDLTIAFSLAEVTPANYALVLNQSTVGAQVDGNSLTLTLYRGGFGVETFSLLVRGEHLSPEGDYNLQYEVPSVYQSGEPEVEYTKDAKALLACEFMAIAALAFSGDAEDADIFGILRVGTA
jgi:hypothetical protein